MDKTILKLKEGYRLYYYQGNFFYPLDLLKNEQDLVDKAIRLFKVANKELISSDRASANYVPFKELITGYNLTLVENNKEGVASV